MRRRDRRVQGMPLFEWNQLPLMPEEVRSQAVDGLADLLLEALQGTAQGEESDDEPEDHA